MKENSTRAHDAGFSLLEMLVVLAIIALSMTITVAHVGQEARVDQRLQAVRIVDALVAARAHARASGRDVAFAVDAAANRWHTVGMKREAADTIAAASRLTLEGARGSLPGEPSVAVVFYPDGSASGGRVTLADAQGQTVITVRWLDAAVSMQQVKP